jgi:crotonobetainyl-CoA:carnitine CoA-transferase CaiB-like acyl-CoA transferase
MSVDCSIKRRLLEETELKIKDLLVIETGPGMAGPLVTRTFENLGARVIKIESSTKIDFWKARLPPPGKTQADMLESQGVQEMNAGKRSVALNLKSEVGRDIFLKLVSMADVYVESYAPGWLERLGLSLAQFAELNPQLVILSQSAYGGEGPLSDQRAYAPLMTALAGVDSTVGYKDGRVVPQIASAVGDVVAAYFGNLLVLSALYQRERTGKGSTIDMSQTEASAAIAGVAYAEYGITGISPQPLGNSHPSCSPHGVYRAAGNDSWVALATWTDDEWEALCNALAIKLDDPARFATTAQRLANNDEVDRLVEEKTQVEDRDILFARLQVLGLSCTPVLHIDEAERLPALVERGLWSTQRHERLGELQLTEVPWHFENVNFGIRSLAEPIGSSTDEILAELLEVSPEQLAEWHESGALT